MEVFHFSKLILLIAHFSFLALQNAPYTTAVAPTPEVSHNAVGYYCQSNCVYANQIDIAGTIKQLA